jgi:short-subunit dehydrogenase
MGTGLAFWTFWQERRRQENAREWRHHEVKDGRGTAFITGASSGIGEVFARTLARQGYSLVLLARREERLAALAEAIRLEHPVQVEILAADLSDPADLERAVIRIGELTDLDILVNNAGFGTTGTFGEVDAQSHLRMIRVHVEATARLTHAALPGMISRGHGGIINVSSMSALLAMPGTVTYGSTKAYLNFFSEGLQAELAGTGVRVQALDPGFTHSEFHDVAGVDKAIIPSFMWMPPGAVVAESLRGLREGRVMVIPGTINRLMGAVLRFPPVAPLARQVQEMRLARQWSGQSRQSG